MRVRKHSTIRKFAIYLGFDELNKTKKRKEIETEQCSKQEDNMHGVYGAIQEAGKFKYKANMKHFVAKNVNCQDRQIQSESKKQTKNCAANLVIVA